MANFTAADVKKLRDATGAGMMDCKKALDEADGDFDKAVELLRIKGAPRTRQARRRAHRHQRPGRRRRRRADRARLRDRLRRQERAVPAARRRHRRARRASQAGDVDGAARRDAGRRPDRRREHRGASAAVIGEKLELRRVAVLRRARSRRTCTSAASDLPPQVGVLVEFEGDDAEAARGAAMQIAAMRPQYLTRDEVPADVVENERRIAEATAREEGKPEQALPKIVEGRVNGFFKDVVLLEQPSVQDSKKTRQGSARRGRRHRDAVRPLRGRRRPDAAGSCDGPTDRTTRRPTGDGGR